MNVIESSLLNIYFVTNMDLFSRKTEFRVVLFPVKPFYSEVKSLGVVSRELIEICLD